MRIRLNVSQTIQSRTGPRYFEAGLVRGEQLQPVIIGDKPGDIPISDFPGLRLDRYLMTAADSEAADAFKKAGL